jgi:hypothetical protein
MVDQLGPVPAVNSIPKYAATARLPSLGSLFDNPYKLGTKPEKASVRAAIRIFQRKLWVIAES